MTRKSFFCNDSVCALSCRAVLCIFAGHFPTVLFDDRSCASLAAQAVETSDSLLEEKDAQTKGILRPEADQMLQVIESK